nr:MmcB family DNA repair protein [Roseococcus suduntuyensis]
MTLDAPQRTLRVTRAATRFCLAQGWAPVTEVPLPDGRRADVLALRPDGGIVILEVKSCARDYLTDAKWQDYCAWSDTFLFAVDADFPQELIPPEVGLLLTDDREAALLRDGACAPLPAARRKALTLRVARLAAQRLAFQLDPAGAVEMRAALRLE